jgi:hypothetical protein
MKNGKTVIIRRSAMILRVLIGIALGAAGGYAYYRFIGCSSGVCPITSNPYVSTVYGAIIGALLSISNLG